MATPQTGIFALGTMSHAWLEFDARSSADATQLVRLVAGLREPRTTIGGVNVVCGFRPEVWATAAPMTSSPGLVGFMEPVVGASGYTLPATQHDAVVWLTGGSYDVIFDVSRRVVAALSSHGTLAHEMVGWPYQRDRDLTGFEDGLENPSLVEATSAAIVPPGSPGEGGTVLLLQQWEHDGGRWEALSVTHQEQAIGRRKRSGAELDPRPETSHVARTDQDHFGKIFRRNIAYGTVTQHGTIFVGFSHERGILDAMLNSMVGKGGMPRDELTEFTSAVSGAYYWVPSNEALAAIGEAPGR